ncbi:MAG: class I SAM-dependent methyltransferase, partial [Anaerolineae bacterium]|nr:class I SAM-dependent methyltransferase [Anaerolineae bacterium]
LPFADKTFDAVYARQVLHHASDLSLLCREVARVLKTGGTFLATREHVISQLGDLEKFLKSHPLHHLYGGENAYLLNEYRAAISDSGLHIVKILGPFDSVINYFPMTIQQWQEKCRTLLAPFLGHKLSTLCINQRHFIGRWVLKRLAHRISNTNNTPGRLYSFMAQKRASL